MASGRVCRLLVLVVLIWLFVQASAVVYIVGDSAGWVEHFNYTEWTAGKTFLVGDSLVFHYNGGHTVDEVSANDYDSCTVGKSINYDTSGATSITLKSPGAHYYICSVTDHCFYGMKIQVNVMEPIQQPPVLKPTTSSSSGSWSSSTILPFAALIYCICELSSFTI